jgi:hypothetical protein
MGLLALFHRIKSHMNGSLLSLARRLPKHCRSLILSEGVILVGQARNLMSNIIRRNTFPNLESTTENFQRFISGFALYNSLDINLKQIKICWQN